MRIGTPTKILMADLQGDRSYLLAFAADDAAYEIFLSGGGWPGDFAGFMTPSIRNQVTGESRELLWPQAEELAARLEPLLAAGPIAKGGEVRARECLEALAKGRRYGREA